MKSKDFPSPRPASWPLKRPGNLALDRTGLDLADDLLKSAGGDGCHRPRISSSAASFTVRRELSPASAGTNSTPGTRCTSSW